MGIEGSCDGAWGMAESAIQQIASHSIGVAKIAATMAIKPSTFCLVS
jgi:hypothetical protein